RGGAPLEHGLGDHREIAGADIVDRGMHGVAIAPQAEQRQLAIEKALPERAPGIAVGAVAQVTAMRRDDGPFLTESLQHRHVPPQLPSSSATLRNHSTMAAGR